MKRSVIDANSIRKSLAKATALVAAAVASASCVVNAADFTVNVPTTMSVEQTTVSYDHVYVNANLTIDGADLVFSNKNSIVIGSDATTPVTIVITNGGVLRFARL